MVVKNYRELCELLGEEIKTSSSKKAQLKRWSRYFLWDKKGHKYTIKEIYDTPLAIEDRRFNGNARGTIRVKDKSFDVSIENAHKPGVYKIENEEYIYIGSTINYLTGRFANHLRNSGGNHTKTQEVLKNGGTFTCLQSFENGTDEATIRECEAEYIRKYRNTDKILLNDKIPEVFSQEEQIKYKKISIPEQYLDDIENILTDAGYLIMGGTVFNKKFIDE